MDEVIDNSEYVDTFTCSHHLDDAITDLSTQDGFDPFFLETQFVPNREFSCDYCDIRARWKFTYRAAGVLQICMFRHCDKEFIAMAADHLYCKSNHRKAEAKYRSKDRKKELNGQNT